MKFRPCIDIHNGKVKQIVGGSLSDRGDFAEENFVSEWSAADYAKLYRRNGVYGGHIILLNGKDSEYYAADISQAKAALEAFPGGMQIGGGITDENAGIFLESGASHVIVTSFVFSEGEIRCDRLKSLANMVSKDKIVLDLSCKKKDGEYYIVTNRWQVFTKQKLNRKLLKELSGYCDEFLIHAADVEGRRNGPDKELIRLLSDNVSIPVTYAGGIACWDDITVIKDISGGTLDFTIGSGLDLFGGGLSFEEIVAKY